SLAAAAPATAATAASHPATAHPATARTASALAGIPSGAPAAAYRSEPRLPRAVGWPFGDAFPRTSGAGREAGGATFWSDFVYDDHGASGIQVQQPVASLAPTGGTYVYSKPKAANNGA